MHGLLNSYPRLTTSCSRLAIIIRYEPWPSCGRVRLSAGQQVPLRCLLFIVLAFRSARVGGDQGGRVQGRS